ncbi:MAG: class I SAM-dependent methyltransferase [Planctomycetota bacterium]|jgi:SAM-dependent methyltransferase
MDDLAYKQFLKLEKTHWWFIGRRNIFFTLLDHHLGEKNDLRIMDVGCGFGGMLDGLSGLGHAMGMEIDLDSAKACQERGFSGMCLGSGYDMPVRTGSLDLITLFDAIEHIEDDERVVRQCAEALKPGGHLMITVPAYQFLYADNDRIAHHLRRYSLPRLKRIVRSADLDVVKGTHYNILLFPLILPAVLLLKLKQKIRGPLKEGREGATNLSYNYPRIVAFLLKTIFSSERHLLKYVSIPFGHSIALIARKK